MSCEPEELGKEDVLFIDEANDQILLDYPTHKVEYMITEIKSAIRKVEAERASWKDQNEDWFEEGVTCEVLRVSSRGWLKGRVKIKFILEFYPEAYETEEILEIEQAKGFEVDSLDDIRQALVDSDD